MTFCIKIRHMLYNCEKWKHRIFYLKRMKKANGRVLRNNFRDADFLYSFCVFPMKFFTSVPFQLYRNRKIISNKSCNVVLKNSMEESIYAKKGAFIFKWNSFVNQVTPRTFHHLHLKRVILNNLSILIIR